MTNKDLQELNSIQHKIGIIDDELRIIDSDRYSAYQKAKLNTERKCEVSMYLRINTNDSARVVIPLEAYQIKMIYENYIKNRRKELSELRERFNKIKVIK
jgi:hypothetical protein